MELVRRGMMAAAAAVAREDNPMAAVLGRACTHLCEETCVRTHMDDPLAIREIKRFIMEQEVAGEEAPSQPRQTKVAIVGGGPCGLSAAWFLSRAGYPVTVFEAHSYSGGMVSGSIPAYRATQSVIEQDLAWIRSVGVEVRHGVEVGRDLSLDQIREQGFAQVVLATGARRGMRLGIPGQDGPGVLDGLELLRASREGTAPKVGPRVGVIGGGDVAMDCARTAARLADGQVTIIYRRTIAQMPAQAEELEEALDEGIAVRELLSPQEAVVTEGRLTALVCEVMELGEPDSSGRRRPMPTGRTEEILLDTLIVAIGQEVDSSFLGDHDLKHRRRGFLSVDPRTLETELGGVYAGGDLIDPGPLTIVKALGDGRRIAEAIMARDGGRAPEPPPSSPELNLPAMLLQRARIEERIIVPRRHPDLTSFDEVIDTYSVEAATLEAGRCLRCDLLCSICTGVCPNRAIFTYEVEPFSAVLPRLQLEAGTWASIDQRPYRLEQGYQVAVITDFCNECGNCATFCPTAGRPYVDKPRLYFDRSEFEAQQDNAFAFSHDGESWMVEARLGGGRFSLRWDDRLRFEAPEGSFLLDPSSLELLDSSPAADVAEGTLFSLEPCMTLLSFLRGIRGSMSHLPLGL
jgi:putative selenate reductase